MKIEFRKEKSTSEKKQIQRTTFGTFNQSVEAAEIESQTPTAAVASEITVSGTTVLEAAAAGTTVAVVTPATAAAAAPEVTPPHLGNASAYPPGLEEEMKP